jgi:hypothetical protein
MNETFIILISIRWVTRPFDVFVGEAFSRRYQRAVLWQSLAALMLFAHSTLRPRHCKSCSIIASGFLPLTNMMVFTGS